MRKELFKRNLRLLIFILLVAGFAGLVFAFAGYFQKSADKERMALEVEKRKEVMTAQKEKDKSAYQDEKTGQYVAGEESDQYETPEKDESLGAKDIEEYPDDNSLDIKYKLDIPDTEIKEYNEKNNPSDTLEYTSIYVLEGGKQIPVVDNEAAQKIQDELDLRCLYKDKKGTKYKDELVDDDGNLLPQVWGDGDINFRIFNTDTGEIKKNFIDEETGKIREDALEYSRGKN